VPAPAPGEQWESAWDGDVGEHSEKPEEAYVLLETYFPTLPKIELNARTRRDGWDVWGAEAPVEEAAAE
jgi:N6-adenosine-specific RNA methylase IME4